MDDEELARANIDADNERERLVMRYGRTAVARIEANVRRLDSLTPPGQVCPACLQVKPAVTFSARCGTDA